MRVTGSCHCGALTYEAELNLENVVICHCTDCQRLSGSAFRTVAMTESGAFKFLTGKPKTYVKSGDSGQKRVQTFCPDCGSPIYSTSVGEGPKVYGVRLGTVDQRDQIVPNKQKWIGSSHSWTQEISLIPLTDRT